MTANQIGTESVQHVQSENHYSLRRQSTPNRQRAAVIIEVLDSDDSVIQSSMPKLEKLSEDQQNGLHEVVQTIQNKRNFFKAQNTRRRMIEIDLQSSLKLKGKQFQLSKETSEQIQSKTSFQDVRVEDVANVSRKLSLTSNPQQKNNSSEHKESFNEAEPQQTSQSESQYLNCEINGPQELGKQVNCPSVQDIQKQIENVEKLIEKRHLIQSLARQRRVLVGFLVGVSLILIIVVGILIWQLQNLNSAKSQLTVQQNLVKKLYYQIDNLTMEIEIKNLTQANYTNCSESVS